MCVFICKNYWTIEFYSFVIFRNIFDPFPSTVCKWLHRTSVAFCIFCTRFSSIKIDRSLRTRIHTCLQSRPNYASDRVCNSLCWLLLWKVLVKSEDASNSAKSNVVDGSHILFFWYSSESKCHYSLVKWDGKMMMNCEGKIVTHVKVVTWRNLLKPQKG